MFLASFAFQSLISKFLIFLVFLLAGRGDHGGDIVRAGKGCGFHGWKGGAGPWVVSLSLDSISLSLSSFLILLLLGFEQFLQFHLGRNTSGFHQQYQILLQEIHHVLAYEWLVYRISCEFSTLIIPSNLIFLLLSLIHFTVILAKKNLFNILIQSFE